MAKSLRSKSKRSFRSKKRDSGKYAAAEAARLNRLSAKLAAVKDAKDGPPVAPLDAAEVTATEDQPEGSCDSETFFACLGLLNPRCVTPQNLARFVDRFRGEWDGRISSDDAVSNAIEDGAEMSVDEPNRSDEKPKSISTHGPRGSRREEWRKSKGMDPIPKRRGMNRQGGLAARRKAGRPARRR